MECGVSSPKKDSTKKLSYEARPSRGNGFPGVAGINLSAGMSPNEWHATHIAH
jgi:hypothetical protein